MGPFLYLFLLSQSTNIGYLGQIHLWWWWWCHFNVRYSFSLSPLSVSGIIFKFHNYFIMVFLLVFTFQTQCRAKKCADMGVVNNTTAVTDTVVLVTMWRVLATTGSHCTHAYSLTCVVVDFGVSEQRSVPVTKFVPFYTPSYAALITLFSCSVTAILGSCTQSFTCSLT